MPKRCSASVSPRCRIHFEGIFLAVAAAGAAVEARVAAYPEPTSRIAGVTALVVAALAALAFVLVLLLADFDDRVLQVELAFAGAAAALSASLYALYRRA